MPIRTNKTDSFLFSRALLSTAYLPPVEFFAVLANSEEVLLERCETFQKQSYRTRCHIYGANGLLALTLPVKRDSTHRLPITEIQIDYSSRWLLQHKRALEAAYMTTPFFEYYKDDLYAVMESGEESLFTFNCNIIKLFCELAGIHTKISFTSDYTPAGASPIPDFRDSIHPKYKGENVLSLYGIEKPYYQVFSRKQGFISNLSMIDLLSHEGPNSISFLRI